MAMEFGHFGIGLGCRNCGPLGAEKSAAKSLLIVLDQTVTIYIGKWLVHLFSVFGHLSGYPLQIWHEGFQGGVAVGILVRILNQDG